VGRTGVIRENLRGICQVGPDGRHLGRPNPRGRRVGNWAWVKMENKKKVLSLGEEARAKWESKKKKAPAGANRRKRGTFLFTVFPENPESQKTEQNTL